MYCILPEFKERCFLKYYFCILMYSHIICGLSCEFGMHQYNASVSLILVL